MFFFFNDTATTEIYTLSLHDALPIFAAESHQKAARAGKNGVFDEAITPVLIPQRKGDPIEFRDDRSEEHTSELQSRQYLVCRLLLEKKKLRILTRHPHQLPITELDTA